MFYYGGGGGGVYGFFLLEIGYWKASYVLPEGVVPCNILNVP